MAKNGFRRKIRSLCMCWVPSWTVSEVLSGIYGNKPPCVLKRNDVIDSDRYNWSSTHEGASQVDMIVFGVNKRDCTPKRSPASTCKLFALGFSSTKAGWRRG